MQHQRDRGHHAFIRQTHAVIDKNGINRLADYAPSVISLERLAKCTDYDLLNQRFFPSKIDPEQHTLVEML